MNENDEHVSGAPETPPGPQNYEEIIARGLPSPDKVALALLEIHQRRLRRQGYGSFKAYLQKRWGMGRARAF